MKDERGTFEFEVRKSTLELVLRLAFTREKLTEANYSELLRKTQGAKTVREIRAIREELRRILRTHKGEGQRDCEAGYRR